MFGPYRKETSFGTLPKDRVGPTFFVLLVSQDFEDVVDVVIGGLEGQRRVW